MKMKNEIIEKNVQKFQTLNIMYSLIYNTLHYLLELLKLNEYDCLTNRQIYFHILAILLR